MTHYHKRKQIFANVSQGVQQGILTRNEARERLGLEPIDGGDSLLVPSNLFPLGEVDDTPPVQPDEDEDESKFYEEQYEDIYGLDSEEKCYNPRKKKPKTTKEMLEEDIFTTEQEALDRAKVIGCEGSHTHKTEDGETVFMPCRSHEAYHDTIGVDEKALSDLDLTATEGMKEEARRGLDWRKKFNRGGTQVGVALATALHDFLG